MMTPREAIAILGHGHPGQRGKYLSRYDRGKIAKLIAEQERRLAEYSKRVQEEMRA